MHIEDELYLIYQILPEVSPVTQACNSENPWSVEQDRADHRWQHMAHYKAALAKSARSVKVGVGVAHSLKTKVEN